MQIPIQNIYYLLCYAWNRLEESDKVSVDITKETELLDLFAKVLIQGVRILLKRGIDKNYQENRLEWAGVKGKLEFSDTIKTGTHLKQRTICTVDEFSGDILSNQLLVATLSQLMQTQGLDAKLKSELKPLIWMFPPVQRIQVRGNLFRQVRLHRNNQFYGFLLNVCELIHQNSLPTEKPGEWAFVDFRRDENKMNKLFEAFLLNFYKRELPEWRVKREYLTWQLKGRSEADTTFLPRMETDISMESDHEKIIMDAKFYRQTLVSRHESSEKIRSNHLYQLFSYLLNQEDGSLKSKRTRGILLYPNTGQTHNLSYTYNEHPIQIRTVDLGLPWKQIDVRLKGIVQETATWKAI